MSVVSNVFGIWAISKTASNTTPIIMRLLAGMAALAVCTLIAAVIITILIIGGTWLFYTQLLIYGVDPQASAVIVGALLLGLLSLIMMAVQGHYARMQMASREMMSVKPLATGPVSRIIDAFLEGFESGHPL